MAVCFTRMKISLGYGLVKHIVSSQNPILGLLVSYRSLFLNICNFLHCGIFAGYEHVADRWFNDGASS